MARKSVRWISEGSDLSAAIAGIGSGPLAMDTEADSFHHYRDKVCLVQLSFGGTDLLVDPLAGLDVVPLGPVLDDAGVRKILHGADYDLRILHRDFGFTVRGLFDTMIAARLVGERAFGLAALLRKFLGVRLDKKFQRADWSQRPLTDEMEGYAVEDTRHLNALAERLEQRLTDLGRAEWAEEEFRRVEAVRWAERDRGEALARVKGSGRLDRRDRAVLGELFELRDRIARSKDVPPFRVLRDEQLVALARSRPREVAAIGAIGALPRSWREGRGARQLVAAVEAGLAIPDDRLPATAARRKKGQDPALETRLRRLCKARDRLARALDLEPSVLASRVQLEQLLSARERGSEPSGTNPLRRWQAAVLRPALEAAAP